MANILELNDQITQFTRGNLDAPVFQANEKLRLIRFMLFVEKFGVLAMNSTKRYHSSSG